MGGVKVAALYAALGLDKKDYDRGLDSAESKSRGWAGKIGGIFKAAGKAIAVGLAIGAAALGALVVKSTNAASDLAESQAKADVVFGDNAKAVEDWASRGARAFGQSKQQALEAAGTYGNLFQAFGVGRDDATEMSTSLVELAADMASFNNTSIDDALVALRSGLSGETEPLKRYGVALSDARMRAELMAMGVTNLGATLTPLQKSQAAYSLIMKDTALAQGDFQRTSEGMANQQRIAAAVFQDTLAGIGAAFLPLANTILPYVVQALEGLNAWVQANLPAIKATIETAVQVISAVFGFLFNEVLPRAIAVFSALFDNVQSNMPTISAIASAVFATVGDVIDFVTANIIPPLMKAIKFVVAWISANWPTISSVFGQVFGAIGSIIKAVWPVIERIATVLFPVVGAAATTLFSVLDFVFKGIGGLFEVLGAVGRLVSGALRAAFRGIGQFFESIFGDVTGVFKGGLNFLVDMVNGFLRWLNNLKITIPRVNIPGTDIGVGGGSIDPFSFNLLPRFAAGGVMDRSGLAWVGEHGPELVALPGGSRVHTAGESRRMLGGRVEVVVRDPDGAIARGGYSQRDIERAVSAALTGMADDMRHRSLRMAD